MTATIFNSLKVLGVPKVTANKLNLHNSCIYHFKSLLNDSVKCVHDSNEKCSLEKS